MVQALTEELAKTGIEGLDEVLGGGIPRGRCILVVGGPGTGKTILGAQFIYNGAKKYGEKGLIVTLEEGAPILKADLRKLGFDLDELENEGLIKIVDHSVVNYLPSEKFRELVKFMDMPVFKAASLLETLKNTIKSLGASRVVIDSISALTFQVADPVERRLHTMLIFKTLLDSGCTSIVISEAKTSQLEREFIFEEYLADGVIVLQNIYQEGNLVKCVYVEKMRGASHDTQPRPYRIDYGGIMVFPKERVFASFNPFSGGV
ncbi:MAG: hypothetical protein DRO46_03960 [Candidatus Hecatellales archaeon]|nr:MAG: hypothetical protein DRO46_03960 [Candidatus Hecatellales archaeon]